MTLARARQALHHTDHRGRLPSGSCCHARVASPQRPSGRNASPSGIVPINHHVAGPKANPRAADRSKAGRPRAHDGHHQPRARTPNPAQYHPDNPDHALAARSLHK